MVLPVRLPPSSFALISGSVLHHNDTKAALHDDANAGLVSTPKVSVDYLPTTRLFTVVDATSVAVFCCIERLCTVNPVLPCNSWSSSGEASSRQICSLPVLSPNSRPTVHPFFAQMLVTCRVQTGKGGKYCLEVLLYSLQAVVSFGCSTPQLSLLGSIRTGVNCISDS